MIRDHQAFQKEITAQTRALRRRIGHNIHDLRLARGWPLDKLSRLCGLNATRIDRFEMGKGEIELHHAIRLGHALQVDILVLLKNP